MHIEINGGGIASFGTMNDLQEQLNVLIGDSTDILSAFKTVESKTVNLNGGIGNLRDAVENIGQRIRKEEQKLQNVKDALNKTIEFTEHTITTDKHVAEIVKNNQEDFYRMHPWLRPPVPEKDKNMFEQAWEHVKEGFREFGEAFKDLFEGIKDTLKKGWDALVEFYEEHKKMIQSALAIGAILLAIAGLFATGQFEILVPLLVALGASAADAAAVSAAVVITGAVTTIVYNVMNLIDIWAEIDNPWFEGFKMAFKSSSTVLNGLVTIGKIYNFAEKMLTVTNVDQLSVKEQARITDYTKDHGSDVYNKPLYQPDKMTPDSEQKIKELHEILSKTSHPGGTFYRGSKMIELDAFKGLPPEEWINKEVIHEAFLSTTSNYQYALDKADDLVWAIHVPSGASGLDISSLSVKQEWETLFDIQQKLLITHVTVADGKYFVEAVMRP